MKHTGFRERYFEDYRPRTRIKPNGRAAVDYVYSGLWYRWGLDGFDLRRRKLLYIVLELGSIALYLLASLQQLPMNTQRLASGLGILSVFSWLIELWGVLGFCVGREYITELDHRTINSRIAAGSILRICLLTASVLCGAAATLRDGRTSALMWLTIAAYFTSAAVSALIFSLHRKIYYRTYKNLDGKVGPEC